MRVLIVDDNLAVRERLAALLCERFDVELDQASDAFAGIEAARARPPALVLLDLHMPGGGGLVALPELKALSPAPVVVVLTADPSEAHRRSCLAKGADHFLDKGADLERVVELLARLTEGRRSSDS
jgi:two-component system nitrate/nitrite response regulator NarL